MLNRFASIGVSSTLNLPTRTLPRDSLAKLSIMPATALQVGHHGAQANNSTGSGDLSTPLSKFPSVTVKALRDKQAAGLQVGVALAALRPAVQILRRYAVACARNPHSERHRDAPASNLPAGLKERRRSCRISHRCRPFGDRFCFFCRSGDRQR